MRLLSVKQIYPKTCKVKLAQRAKTVMNGRRMREKVAQWQLPDTPLSLIKLCIINLLIYNMFTILSRIRICMPYHSIRNSQTYKTCLFTSQLTNKIIQYIICCYCQVLNNKIFLPKIYDSTYKLQYFLLSGKMLIESMCMFSIDH